MDNNVILLIHPTLGGLATLAALWVSGLIVPISLSMEGSGAIIAIAVKIGLLFKQPQSR